MARTAKPQDTASTQVEHRIVVEKNILGENTLELEKKLVVEMSKVNAPVVLDLSRITLIDSRGIALCVGLLKECGKKRLPFSIEAGPTIVRFFTILKLDRVFQITERGTV